MRHLILGCAILLAPACEALAQPAEVIIIRHAEKPQAGNELSLKGQERAAALVPYFRGTPEVLEYKTLVAIYAQAAKKETSSVRSFETAKPLADALNLTINQRFTRDEFQQMVKEIMDNHDYDGHTVLICWEHKVIPRMAGAFGVEDAPTKWPDQEFDRTWVITFKEGEKPRFKNLPQKLMYGDADK
ncbi:MAG TPA: histidine phosphatase family protein [Pirellulales bacterium]|jgi:hypothetical protein|nr:histidine phosphatase family protein [Pirellulales bacterium]